MWWVDDWWGMAKWWCQMPSSEGSSTLLMAWWSAVITLTQSRTHLNAWLCCGASRFPTLVASLVWRFAIWLILLDNCRKWYPDGGCARAHTLLWWTCRDNWLIKCKSRITCSQYSSCRPQRKATWWRTLQRLGLAAQTTPLSNYTVLSHP